MNRKTKVFVGLTLLASLIGGILLLIPATRTYQMHMFFASGRDFFADLLNNLLSLSVSSSVEFNPYHYGVISTSEQLYPPFAYALMLPFVRIFPKSVHTLAQCHATPVAMAIVGVVMLLMIAAIAYSCIACCRKFKLSNMVTAALMLSGLTLATVERGNLIAFALLGAVVFLCIYDSDNPVERFLAALGLALAVALKVTPVLFGVLWLNKKDFKYLVLAGMVTVIMSFTPLLFSSHSIIENISQLLCNVAEHERIYADVSMSINPSCVLNAGVRVLALPLAGLVPLVKWISFLVGAAGLWMAVRKAIPAWKRLFLLAAAQVLIPSAPQTYVALFFIPALIAFLADERETRLTDICFLAVFLVLTTAIPLFVITNVSMNFAFSSAAIVFGALFLEIQCFRKNVAC